MSNTPPLEDLIREHILWAPVAAVFLGAGIIVVAAYIRHLKGD